VPALQLAVHRRPVGLGETAVSPLLADCGKELRVQRGVGGDGQPSPASKSRFNVGRTVDGATPTRRAISLPDTRQPSTEACRAPGA